MDRIVKDIAKARGKIPFAAIARETGFSVAEVSRWLRGIRIPRTDQADLIREAINSLSKRKGEPW